MKLNENANKIILKIKKGIGQHFPCAKFHKFRGPLGFYPDKKKNLFVHVDLYPNHRHSDDIESSATLFYRFVPKGMKNRVGLRPIADPAGNIYSKQLKAKDPNELVRLLKDMIDNHKQTLIKEKDVYLEDLNKKDLAHQYGHEFLHGISNKFKIYNKPMASKEKMQLGPDADSTFINYYLAKLTKPFEIKKEDYTILFKKGFYIAEESHAIDVRIIAGEFVNPGDAFNFLNYKLEDVMTDNSVSVFFDPIAHKFGVNPNQQDTGHRMKALQEAEDSEDSSFYLKVVKLMSTMSSENLKRQVAERYVDELVKDGALDSQDKEEKIDQMIKDAEYER